MCHIIVYIQRYIKEGPVCLFNFIELFLYNLFSHHFNAILDYIYIYRLYPDSCSQIVGQLDLSLTYSMIQLKPSAQLQPGGMGKLIAAPLGHGRSRRDSGPSILKASQIHSQMHFKCFPNTLKNGHRIHPNISQIHLKRHLRPIHKCISDPSLSASQIHP